MREFPPQTASARSPLSVLRKAALAHLPACCLVAISFSLIRICVVVHGVILVLTVSLDFRGPLLYKSAWTTSFDALRSLVFPDREAFAKLFTLDAFYS